MGIFMAFLFVLSSKKYSYHIHNVTAVLLLISFILLTEITEESNIVDSYPFLIGIGSLADLLLWPFLLFYTQYIIGERTEYGWSSLLYFSPFVIALIWQVPFFLLSPEIKLTYFVNGIPSDIAVLVGFKMLCSIAFLLYILYLLNGTISRFSRIFPRNRKVHFLSKARLIFSGITAFIILIYLMFFNQYFELLPLGDTDRIGSLILSGFIYFFALLIFRHPRLFEEENYSKSVKEFFMGTEPQYTKELLTLFDTTKIYLNEKLAVKDVAIEMGLTDQQISYLINRKLGISFLDFINTYRVKEVQKNIHKGNHQLKTLLGLALESGFNSKASFNRIFKDHTGLTPSTYIKSLKN